MACIPKRGLNGFMSRISTRNFKKQKHTFSFSNCRNNRNFCDLFNSSRRVKVCEKVISSVRHASTASVNVVGSPSQDMEFPPFTVPECIWKNLANHADHIALECAETGRNYTYKKARDLSRKFGAALLKSGFKPGDVLSIMLPNIPEFALALLGALEAGLVVSTINPMYTAYELRHQMEVSGATGIVTLPSMVPLVKQIFKEIETEFPIITVNCNEAKVPETWDFNEMISNCSDSSDIDAAARSRTNTDVAALPFSSGTTGLSKGVVLTHSNIISNIHQMMSPSIHHFRDTTSEHQDILPACLPFFHIYGMVVILLRGLFNGSKIITMPKFDPATYLKLLSSQKPSTSVCYCAPPMILFLGAHPLVKKEYLKSVRVVTNGAGPVGSSDIEKLLNRLPNTDVLFLNAYGLTETSPVVFTPLLTNTEYLSVGSPLANTRIRVVDGEGNNLGPDAKGEIYVKGPQVMKEYYKNEKATLETFDEDRWFKTGDVGYYDKENRFFIVDRLKELIKVKGFQVPPAELEAILRSHSGVVDAGVIGVEDERTGEKPVAFIVPKPNIKLDPKQISDFVADKVAPHKKLAQVILTDMIPKSPSGKILRRILKEKYADECFSAS